MLLLEHNLGPKSHKSKLIKVHSIILLNTIKYIPCVSILQILNIPSVYLMFVSLELCSKKRLGKCIVVFRQFWSSWTYNHIDLGQIKYRDASFQEITWIQAIMKSKFPHFWFIFSLSWMLLAQIHTLFQAFSFVSAYIPENTNLVTFSKFGTHKITEPHIVYIPISAM